MNLRRDDFSADFMSDQIQTLIFNNLDSATSQGCKMSHGLTLSWFNRSSQKSQCFLPACQFATGAIYHVLPFRANTFLENAKRLNATAINLYRQLELNGTFFRCRSAPHMYMCNAFKSDISGQEREFWSAPRYEMGVLHKFVIFCFSAVFEIQLSDLFEFVRRIELH
jgi:hypothetical protein